MDAEKNVVEAARKLLKLIQPNAVGGFDVTGNLHDELRELMGAIAAYDSAPAPSEDRVREAAEAAIIAWSGREADPKGWPEDTRNVITALRPYVTPAPALHAGTVAVEVSLLKRWRVAMSRCIATNGSPTHNLSLPEIDALLPPPPRPEPSAGLVEEWKAAARAESDKAYDAKLAALRAAWEAEKWGA